jgi:hypothetical protein
VLSRAAGGEFLALSTCPDMGREYRRTAGDIWRLAQLQHGVITRVQLLEAGLSSDEVDSRIARGRLHRTWRGVYAVGRPQLTRHGWWMAAVLACGARAFLSHGSAAALWRIQAMKGEFNGESTRPREIQVRCSGAVRGCVRGFESTAAASWSARTGLATKASR